MTNIRSPVVEIGQTNFRNRGTPFGIKLEDRRLHTYIIGKTGTGKSTLIENMVLQDILHGHGLVLLDPHGDLVEKILQRVPGDQLNRIRYFNVPDSSQEFGFNPLATVPEAYRSVAASGLLSVFKKLWDDSWGPRLEHILRNAILALIDFPGATLADIPRLLNERSFRQDVVRHSTNISVREFWLKEYEKYPAPFRAQAIAPIQNKVGAFLAHGRLRAILSQPKSSLRLRASMDAGDVILINLAKGRIGEDAARLLGSMLVSTVAWTALTRASLPEPTRRDFFVYLDECQTFATPSLIDMMAELRKYHVGLILAHQHLAQLTPDLRDAILGNAGSLISFRIGPPDASRLALEFSPEFDEQDLTRLPNFHIYVKIMLNGAPTPPFSAVSVSPDRRIALSA